MENLIIEATDDCPKVEFSSKDGKMIISGKSLPEDVISFYNPMLSWLEEYSKNPAPDTQFTFKLTYFNTSSSKLILDILMILEKMNEEGKSVQVNWYYSEYDEDMKEAGNEYSEMVNVNFRHFEYTQ